MNDRPGENGAGPDGAERGRRARAPSDIPLLGWRDIAWRVWTAIGEDNISILAAGVAFYAMLATFPAITAFVSLFGVFADPAQVQQQFELLRGIIPGDAWRLLNDQLTAVASTDVQRLSIGAGVALAIAVWSAGAGVRAMMSALNTAYREHEKRSFFGFYLTAFLFTCGIIFAGLVSLSVIFVVPIVLSLIQLGDATRLLVRLAPWVILAVFMTACLGVLYRYGPSRREAKSRWVSWGAAVATVLWLGASVLFSVYVAHFASYNQTYGTLGAVIILLMWYWISAFAVLLGAALNAEMELQTEHDTTIGRARPRGRRGAFVADHLGDVP